MRNHLAQALKAARRLRNDMSLPEVLLWKELRRRPFGLKFRRQHPVGRFVADFYCASANLIIEIDGVAHDMSDRPTRDCERDRWFANRGIDVIHIPARDVLNDANSVAASVAAKCTATPPPSALRAATSPDGGGDSGSSL